MTRRPSVGCRWSNAPVPEPHVAGLLAGAALERIAPLPIPGSRRLARASGWLLTAVGTAFAAWAIRAVGEVDTAEPSALVTTGPYVYSRNPMYVAWTLVYTGASLIANTAWPLALLPAVAGWTHVVVLHEERELEATFGEEYRDYEAAVRRYV